MTAGESIKKAAQGTKNVTDRVVDAVEDKVDDVTDAEWDSEGGALERDGDDAAAAERGQRWKDAKDLHWHRPSYTDETRDRSDEH